MHIVPACICTDETNVSEQEWQEIGMSTSSKTLKYLNVNNFSNFHCNIDMLYLKTIILIRAIQLKSTPLF